MDENKTTSKHSVAIPDAKELLKAGAQFGHETKRWNPKMKKFIYGEKNNIHIIDVEQTISKLDEAAQFLKDAASRGNVLFVATKRQASDIVKEEAIRAGSYFINVRWAGGLLTNFKMIKESLNKLNSLETMFEEGVQGRTKYEVSRMKKEWQKLDRLYSGIKSLSTKPTAVVVLDTNYEHAAVRECRKIGIPLVGVVDTNSDPESVNYPIPANDDAINSIKLILKVLADAVLEGNKGHGVKHNLKDYSKVEVKITKTQEEEKEEAEAIESEETETKTVIEAPKTARKSSTKTKGILEKVKEEAEKSKTQKTETKETKKPAARKKTTETKTKKASEK